MWILTYFDVLVPGLAALALLGVLLRHRPRVAGGLGGLGHLVLAGVTGFVQPEGNLWQVGSLPLAVDGAADLRWGGFGFHLLQANQPVVGLLLLVTGLALLLTALAPEEDAAFAIWAPLLTGGMIFLLLLKTAPMHSVLLVPLGLAGAMVLAAFGLQGYRLGHVQGPLRVLLLPMLAVPFFLLAAWYVEQLDLNPQEAELAAGAGYLLALGMLVLLAPVPLHTAQSSLLMWVRPVPGIWLLLVYQIGVIALLYHAQVAFTLLGVTAPLNLWLALLGMVTAIWAGLAATGVGHPGRLVGHALLYEWGLLLLVMAAPGPQNWPLVIFLLGTRVVGALTVGLGLANLHVGPGRDHEHLAGIGSRRPMNSAALLIGGLGLAGFPLTAGFTAHWAALQYLALQDWRIAAAVLVAGAGVVFGFVRLARQLFGGQARTAMAREPIVAAVAAAGVLVAAAGLSLSPQLLTAPLTWALTAFGY